MQRYLKVLCARISMVTKPDLSSVRMDECEWVSHIQNPNTCSLFTLFTYHTYPNEAFITQNVRSKMILPKENLKLATAPFLYTVTCKNRELQLCIIWISKSFQINQIGCQVNNTLSLSPSLRLFRIYLLLTVNFMRKQHRMKYEEKENTNQQEGGIRRQQSTNQKQEIWNGK